MKKIIFLDIDGVLNNQLWYGSDKHKALPQSSKIEWKISQFDPTSMKFLKSLLIDTKAEIVISSSWRKSNSLENLRTLFEPFGIPKEKIIGLTPIINYSKNFGSVPRGCEIKSWLDKRYTDSQRGEYQYVILDDDSDMLLWQQENYFRVDGYCGLTPNIIYRVTRFLNKYK